MQRREPAYSKFRQDLSDRNVINLNRVLEGYDGLGCEYITKRDVDTYQDLVGGSSEAGLVIAGSVALEIASKPENTEAQKLEWLTNANDNWSSVIDKGSRLGHISNFVIESAMQKSSLPSYMSLLLNSELPNTKVMQKYYADLCSVGNCMYDKFQNDYAQRESDTFNSKPEVIKRIRLAGLIGELAVTMLFQRFVRNELGDKEQVALPSLFSQDRGINRNRGSTEVRAWDVTVFQQFDHDDIETPYLIQVKTTKNHPKKDKFHYTKDISMLHIKEDLAINDQEERRGFSPIHIIADLLSEQEGSDSPSTKTRLDQRTDKLLDVIND